MKRHARTTIAVITLITIGLLFGLSAPARTLDGPKGKAVGILVKVAFNKKLKHRILVDAHGFTLYMFINDTQGEPTCIGDLPLPGCSKAWPALTTDGTARPGRGVRAALLGTVKRRDGLLQVMYNRHPLYYFHGYPGTHPDKKPGDIHGQASSYYWYVLSPAGKPIK